MQGTELKTRQSLIERLKDQDDKESWREFFNAYWKLIFGFARKSGLTEDEAEEVVQETMVTISNKLKDYTYNPKECSFKSWIFHKTKWRIIDQIRKRPPDLIQHTNPKKSPDRTATVEKVPDENSADMDKIWDEEWQQNLMEVATARAKDKVSIRQFQIFELSVLRGCSLAQVKRLLKVSSAHVYVAKYKVSTRIKKEIKKLEEEMG